MCLLSVNRSCRIERKCRQSGIERKCTHKFAQISEVFCIQKLYFKQIKLKYLLSTADLFLLKQNPKLFLIVKQNVCTHRLEPISTNNTVIHASIKRHTAKIHQRASCLNVCLPRPLLNVQIPPNVTSRLTILFHSRIRHNTEARYSQNAVSSGL